MTPLCISIALHYHCRADDYGRGNGDNNFSAPAVQQAFTDFCNAGLLRKSPGGAREYDPTPGLMMYVNALVDVPWPTREWVMPRVGQ